MDEGQLLHLHRAHDWYESALEPIPEDEWRVCVARHDDLVDGDAGEVTWVGHPDGHAIAFGWEDGRISTDAPDGPTRVRLAQLAAELGASLQGDDLTLFGQDGEALPYDEGPAEWVDLDADDMPDEIVLDEPWEEPARPLFDPTTPTSRGEFLRSIFRRE